MNTEFIIVVEADNKRANAAYLKGLHDLSIVWPQIEKMCEILDAKNQRKLEEYDADTRKIYANSARGGYDYSLALYHRTSGRFYIEKSPTIEYYQSIRNVLQEMADLSGVAIGPFRMTEYKVKDMIAWENGSNVQDIMKKVDKVLKGAEHE